MSHKVEVSVLDLVLTNKEVLVRNVKLKDSLGCSDHEMLEFNILGAGRRAYGRLTTPDLSRVDFGLTRDFLGRVPWEEVPKVYSRIVSSRLKNNASLQRGNHGRMPGGLHG